MNQVTVSVVDYGSGNLLSVCRALEHCGATSVLVRSYDEIMAASHLVLPGVGAFQACMDRLCGLSLDEPIRNYVRGGGRLLGICVGMQILFESGEEFGHHSGLALLEGKITRIPGADTDGQPLKIPHIGWSDLQPASRDWRGSVLSDLLPGTPVYFIHSYAAQETRPDNRLATCSYGGHELIAAVQAGNVIGCQFHPEKSGEAGLKILRRFAGLSGNTPDTA